MMRVLEHEHPLKFIDLHVNDEDVEESDEEEKEKDMVKQDEFSCTCKRCGEDINVYYRYYYKCIDDSCDFCLHKFCAEVPATLKHISHPLPLTLYKTSFPWKCNNCRKEHKEGEVSYISPVSYLFLIDVNCGVKAHERRIYHPSHLHPLVSLFSKPILCECNACGKEHKGIFFQCTTCSNFAIHGDCAFLPKKLLIQQTTNSIFNHTHPLTLSYSFPRVEQGAKYRPTCRVCNCGFSHQDNLWIYKCERCIYYVHLDCATSRIEPFMSILSIGRRKTIKNFKDADYPDLIHLPFPDQTCSLPKHLLFKEPRPTTYGTSEVSLQHTNHQHELILVDTEGFRTTSSKIKSNIMCHNPMKKIELLCNACIRPIMEMPFYKCRANEDERCNFALHEWCTRLPTKVDSHPGHPQHTLVLMSNVPGAFNQCYCGVCHLLCNGYAYGCVECNFYVDVTCGLMPEKITHESHPNHLLSMVKEVNCTKFCHMCRNHLGLDSFYRLRDWLSFSCKICDVYIHPECALLLPKTIMHTYDKHPMHLSYLPIENHKSEYFCEICEEKLNPHSCFYHCDVCAQSVHSACAPLILQSERETHSRYGKSIYLFLNVKFGSIHKINDHPHPLSFAQGIQSDGECSMCAQSLMCKLTLRCLECGFAIHHYCLNA